MSDGVTDSNREFEKTKKETIDERDKLKEKLENIIKEQQDKIESLNKINGDRNGLILYFVNNYLRYPTERGFKQLTTVLEADFMDVSLKKMKQEQDNLKKEQ